MAMHVSYHSLLVWAIIGLIAGMLASRVMIGHGMGILMDIVVGIVGAILGSFLAAQFGITVGSGLISDIIVAFVGALILLALLRLVGFGRGRRRAY